MQSCPGRDGHLAPQPPPGITPLPLLTVWGEHNLPAPLQGQQSIPFSPTPQGCPLPPATGRDSWRRLSPESPLFYLRLIPG